MRNYLQSFRVNADRMVIATRRRTPTWLPMAGVCVVAAVLIAVAIIIVTSLIPVYLSKKGANIVVDEDNSVGTIDTVFATDFSSTVGETITDLDSMAKQLNNKMGYSNDVLSVQSGSFGAGDVISSKKRKRQLRNAVSCDSVDTGSSVGKGNKFSIKIVVNKCPKTKCKTVYCIAQCAPEVKVDIQSKIGSTSFNIRTNLGVRTVSCRFCTFGQVVPGNRNKL
ncbi:unnamed protein product [Adineta steineri]|uniref:Uncharacterized protein n=1 Tax=Adineta steineri TaxID=433720 RepID=A0A813M9E5_9BILA|nr:unnamed protein product [Adineta steineri]